MAAVSGHATTPARGDDATTILATYAAGLTADDLPEPVLRQARTILADQLGVLLSANRRRAVGIASRTLPGDGGPCTVVGHGAGWSLMGKWRRVWAHRDRRARLATPCGRSPQATMCRGTAW